MNTRGNISQAILLSGHYQMFTWIWLQVQYLLELLKHGNWIEAATCCLQLFNFTIVVKHDVFCPIFFCCTGVFNSMQQAIGYSAMVVMRMRRVSSLEMRSYLRKCCLQWNPGFGLAQLGRNRRLKQSSNAASSNGGIEQCHSKYFKSAVHKMGCQLCSGKIEHLPRWLNGSSWSSFRVRRKSMIAILDGYECNGWLALTYPFAMDSEWGRRW
jgi:hypothetical protein